MSETVKKCADCGLFFRRSLMTVARRPKFVAKRIVAGRTIYRKTQGQRYHCYKCSPYRLKVETVCRTTR